MKPEWDYSELAANYHNRAPYSENLIDDIIEVSGLTVNAIVCDMGAGTGFLAREFAAKNIAVKAIEPNEHMQKYGRSACKKLSSIQWYTTQAEETSLGDSSVDMVSFGSSFNVVDQELALAEAARVCRPKGWFLAVWNHRDLTTGLQHRIESCIKQHIPLYDYGSRRDDLKPYLKSTGRFTEIHSFESGSEYEQQSIDVIKAWHSHATLQRQAGELHANILEEIATMIRAESGSLVTTRFLTKGWLARFGD